MRLFAALPLSAEAVERLTSFRLRWSAPGDGLRWSLPAQWHVTLQFYGDVHEEMARCLQEHLGRLRSSSAEILLEGLGTFAPKGILFAKIELSPAMEAVHAQVVACSMECGFLPDWRPFRPHITLARSKGKAGNSSIHRLARPTLPSLGPDLRWIPDECLLLESVLHPQGAEYSVRSRVTLQRPSRTSVELG